MPTRNIVRLIKLINLRLLGIQRQLTRRNLLLFSVVINGAPLIKNKNKTKKHFPIISADHVQINVINRVSNLQVK